MRAHKIDIRKTIIWSLRNAGVGDFFLDPAKVRQDKKRVVGVGIGPSIPQASCNLTIWQIKEKICRFVRNAGCLGAWMWCP